MVRKCEILLQNDVTTLVMTWDTQKNGSKCFGFQFLGTNEKVFLGAVMSHGEKVKFCCFLARKNPYNHLTRRHGIQRVRKWRLVVKILREKMRDMLFLDVFNLANFSCTPKKDGPNGEFLSTGRRPSLVMKSGILLKNWNPKIITSLFACVTSWLTRECHFRIFFRTFWPFLALLTRVLHISRPGWS